MEDQRLNSKLIGTDSGYVLDIRSDESKLVRVDPPCFESRCTMHILFAYLS